MTQSQFICTCNEFLIDPALALENENILSALRARDDDLIITILKEEY